MNVVPIFPSIRVATGKSRKAPKSLGSASLQQPQLLAIQGDLHPSSHRKPKVSDMPVRSRADIRAFLRRNILSLYVPQVGLTIQQILTEVEDKTDSEDADDSDRCSWLEAQLNRVGFWLTSIGGLVLTWPERFVDQYPHLQELRPERYFHEDFS